MTNWEVLPLLCNVAVLYHPELGETKVEAKEKERFSF